LSVEGRAARNRRGVAIIVHGAPLTGKTKAATVLAKHYDCPLLTIDSIITDAIANSKSTSAARARQLCAEAATKHAEEQRALDAIMQQNAAANAGTVNSTGLSAEALAQHSLKGEYLLK
jgi:hydrocephalus-inducing protein